MLLWASLGMLVGFTVLVWGANRFVEGAQAFSIHMGFSPLLVGALVLGLGTSAPEAFISMLASWQGNEHLVIGNAYGSNIANLALVLGVTALFFPLKIMPEIGRKELWLLILSTALTTTFLLTSSQLGRLEALGLLIGFSAVIAVMVLSDKQAASDSTSTSEISVLKMIAYLTIGLLCLILGSRLSVWGAVEIARYTGISDLVIGLSIVSLGSSLPELAASIAAAKKGEDDLVIGNILGSNTINMLLVIGIGGLIRPLSVLDINALWRDALLGLALALFLCFPLILHKKANTKVKLQPFQAIVLSGSYLGYVSYLYLG